MPSKGKITKQNARENWVENFGRFSVFVVARFRFSLSHALPLCLLLSAGATSLLTWFFNIIKENNNDNKL